MFSIIMKIQITMIKLHNHLYFTAVTCAISKFLFNMSSTLLFMQADFSTLDNQQQNLIQAVSFSQDDGAVSTSKDGKKSTLLVGISSSLKLC